MSHICLVLSILSSQKHCNVSSTYLLPFFPIEGSMRPGERCSIFRNCLLLLLPRLGHQLFNRHGLDFGVLLVQTALFGQRQLTS